MFLQLIDFDNCSEDLTFYRNNKNHTKITFDISASVRNGLLKKNPKTYKMILCFSVFKKNSNHNGMIFRINIKKSWTQTHSKSLPIEKLS